MLIVRKNQVFDQEWQVCQYVNGEFVGVVSGMGRNAGTWGSAAKSKRTAQRWAKQCTVQRLSVDGYIYTRWHSVCGDSVSVDILGSCQLRVN